MANAPTRILSPQHFAQQMQHHKPHVEGTGCIQMHNYEHYNSPVLGPKKVHQDSQAQSQTQHCHDEYSPGNTTI